MTDAELGSPSSYSRFIVTIGQSRLVLEILVCDRLTDERTDNVDHYYRWPTQLGEPAKNSRPKHAHTWKKEKE